MRAIGVVVALAAVGAQGEFQLLRLVLGPDEDVVVADEGLPLAVGRGLGLGRGGFGRRAALAQPVPARTARLDRAELGQGAGCQVEFPAESAGLELDGLLVVDEGDRRERQLLGIDPFPSARRPARPPARTWSKAGALEALSASTRTNCEPAGHRLAVPEAVGRPDPGRHAPADRRPSPAISRAARRPARSRRACPGPEGGPGKEVLK